MNLFMFLQFKILQDFCKLPEESYYDGMRYLEILLFHKSFRALLEPGKSREEVYQRYLRPYQDRFAQIASSFEFKDNKETGANSKEHYGQVLSRTGPSTNHSIQ